MFVYSHIILKLDHVKYTPIEWTLHRIQNQFTIEFQDLFQANPT